MRLPGIILLSAVAVAQFVCSAVAKADDVRSGMAYIRNGEATLPGYFYKPQGKGPFPAVVLVRAASRPVSDANPPYREVANAFVARGYVVIAPCWEIPARLMAEREKDPTKKHRRLTLPEFQAQASCIAAAVSWAKSQSYVDENKIAVVGHAAGGVLAMLLADQEIGVRGYVAFSPAAGMWNEHVDLQKSFVNCVREARAPIFLIQPQNDLGLGPSELLGSELARRGDLSMSKVYPPFGKTREQANSFGVAGVDVWGSDVFKFLEQALN